MRLHYVIRGGLEGRERLRVLARVIHPTTASLFDRVGLSDGHRCLDVGCGGGDVTFELARRVAPKGSALGVDIDEAKLEIAQNIGVGVVQVVATKGDAKLISPSTMENITRAVLADGLTSQAEIDDTVRELYEFAADPTTVAGTPRIVQSWGRRPAAS